MKLSISQIGCIVLASLMLAGAVYVMIEKHSYDSQITSMNNAIAEKDKTIEVKQGLYEKATLETKNLQDLLDGKDTQITDLKKELDKKDQELIAATNLVIKWRADYQALVAATQTTIPGTLPTDPSRTKVAFEKDFGPILVSGYTLTAPPEAFVSLHQQRPLKLTLALSQDENKLWHTYVTSSEENMAAEITLSGVNPYFGDPKWYEHLSGTATVAAGGSGVLGGLGVGVDVSQFTISAMVYDHSSNLVAPLYGIGFQWRPFKK